MQLAINLRNKTEMPIMLMYFPNLIYFHGVYVIDLLETKAPSNSRLHKYIVAICHETTEYKYEWKRGVLTMNNAAI